MKLHDVDAAGDAVRARQNAGISHNPLEAITNDDAELAVRAFQNLLGELAADPARQQTR